MTQISRRDFLRIAGLTALSSLSLDIGIPIENAATNLLPKVIVILCDALSAKHLSLYGYARQTTPNIDAFAERSFVYHNHFSDGNFTTPGVGSMLTGMSSWKHRAINLGGLISRRYERINPYAIFGPDYQRLAFSQNIWPDRLIGQCYDEVDRFLSPISYSLLSEGPAQRMLKNDPTISSLALDDFMLSAQGETPTGSLLSGYLYKSFFLRNVVQQKRKSYSKGLPEIQMSDGFVAPYLNEELFKGIYLELSKLNARGKPFFAYFHAYSPHSPYRPRNDFGKLFRDDYFPVSKPIHPFSENVVDDIALTQRTLYDCQIAQVDHEFGKLIARLDEDGILENSYLIFTSDHGELFERGFVGHGTRLMYEPVLHIPLLIHAPGQKVRKDIRSSTSNIDILPTLLSVLERKPPMELDGRALPEMGGQENEDRTIFSTFAAENLANAPLNKAVIAMRKRDYKLIAYFGCDDYDQVFEWYDLDTDPEELVNLGNSDSREFNEMKEELYDRLSDANRPFLT